MADYQLRLEEVDLEDWLEWALAHDVEVLVVIRLRPCLRRLEAPNA